MSAPPPTAGAPARVAPKPSLNLLDFDDTTAMSPPPLAQPEPTGVRRLTADSMESPLPLKAHGCCSLTLNSLPASELDSQESSFSDLGFCTPDALASS